MVTVDADQAIRWRMGQAIAILENLSGYIRMYSPEQEFLGLSEVCEAGLQPIVVLSPIN